MVKELVEGDQAPDFELPTDGGGRAHLKGLTGKPVVLYFYPKDDTSGCTAEAIDFNGLRAKFAAADARSLEFPRIPRRATTSSNTSTT